jgi:hypothetical protein
MLNNIVESLWNTPRIIFVVKVGRGDKVDRGTASSTVQGLLEAIETEKTAAVDRRAVTRPMRGNGLCRASSVCLLQIPPVTHRNSISQ